MTTTQAEEQTEDEGNDGREGVVRYRDLAPALKRLVNKIGDTPDHTIVSHSGKPGKGWEALYDLGWLHIRDDACGDGYTIKFSIDGWDAWSQYLDEEEASGKSV